MKKVIIGIALASIILLCCLPVVVATSCIPACDSTKTTCTYERDKTPYEPPYPTTEYLPWTKVKCYYDQSRHFVCYWTHSKKVCEKYDLYEVCVTKKYCCTNGLWDVIETKRTLKETGKVKCTIQIIESKLLPYGQTP
jgi:hypothetical protein